MAPGHTAPGHMAPGHMAPGHMAPASLLSRAQADAAEGSSQAGSPGTSLTDTPERRRHGMHGAGQDSRQRSVPEGHQRLWDRQTQAAEPGDGLERTRALGSVHLSYRLLPSPAETGVSDAGAHAMCRGLPCLLLPAVLGGSRCLPTAGRDWGAQGRAEGASSPAHPKERHRGALERTGHLWVPAKPGGGRHGPGRGGQSLERSILLWRGPALAEPPPLRSPRAGPTAGAARLDPESSRQQQSGHVHRPPAPAARPTPAPAIAAPCPAARRAPRSPASTARTPALLLRCPPQPGAHPRPRHSGTALGALAQPRVALARSQPRRRAHAHTGQRGSSGDRGPACAPRRAPSHSPL
ncbi:uncharacterized protein LOC141967919 [Athene noctua]|uniref:uncharacterized protein LOC141967919 n=1 Tax=Athene noctua TaxID=126797 RepID=UPI003EBEA23C